MVFPWNEPVPVTVKISSMTSVPVEEFKVGFVASKSKVKVLPPESLKTIEPSVSLSINSLFSKVILPPRVRSPVSERLYVDPWK